MDISREEIIIKITGIARSVSDITTETKGLIREARRFPGSSQASLTTIAENQEKLIDLLGQIRKEMPL